MSSFPKLSSFALMTCLAFGAYTPVSATEPLNGTWVVEFTNGVVEACQARVDGKIWVFEPLRTSPARPAVEGGATVLTFEDDRVERWTPVGSRYVVEHWFPATQYPSGKPVLGIAEQVATNDLRGNNIAGIVQFGGRIAFGERKTVESVSFVGPRFPGDPYLMNLGNLKELQALSLVDTKLNGEGLQFLKELKNLTRLEFKGSLSEHGLREIGAMTQLKQLDLRSTGHAADAVTKELKGLIKLERLSLECCQLTEAGLEPLKGMGELAFLDLSDTTVGDAGLVHLKGLTKLKTLIVKKTNVTEAGVRKLQESLPKCVVAHSSRD